MLSKIITAFFLFFSMVYPNYHILESIIVDSKINGFIVNLQLDSLPDQKNLSAWQANTGWFYITLYECRLEQKNNLKPKTNDEIISFQLIENDESLQLGFKMKKPIEQFHFTQDPVNDIITATLHYSTKMFENIDEENFVERRNHNRGLSVGLRYWLNITGTSLTISGLLKNGKKSNDELTIVGLSIIVGTFVLDRILKDF